MSAHIDPSAKVIYRGSRIRNSSGRSVLRTDRLLGHTSMAQAIQSSGPGGPHLRAVCFNQFNRTGYVPRGNPYLECRKSLHLAPFLCSPDVSVLEPRLHVYSRLPLTVP